MCPLVLGILTHHRLWFTLLFPLLSLYMQGGTKVNKYNILKQNVGVSNSQNNFRLSTARIKLWLDIAPHNLLN